MRIDLPRTDRERAEALACLLGGPAEDAAARVREALALAESGEIDLSGLIAAWDGPAVAAAALSCTAPDGSAFVWPPETRVTGEKGGAIAAALLRELAARLDSAGFRFAQTVVEPDREDHCRVLDAAGFTFLADLNSLRRPLDDPPPAADEIRGNIVAFSETRAARFENVVERTYRGSRDCPGFAGLRSAGEALRAYRTVGEFTPRRWWLIERDGRDEGVILVNDRNDERAREIVYLGVTPAARRERLGSALVSQVLVDAFNEEHGAVLTAVDGTNLPAVRLYERLGFSLTSRRRIFLRRQAKPPSDV